MSAGVTRWGRELLRLEYFRSAYQRVLSTDARVPIMERTANRELRHDRHTVSLLSDHMVFAPKYRGKRLREAYPHLKEWCGDHLWAPSCFHGSVGNGWEVVSKYIETQDVHHAKSAIYRPRP